MGTGGAARARRMLREFDAAAASPEWLCDAALRAVREVAHFDWGAVMTTDPETSLPSGGVVEGFAPAACVPFWDNELTEPDVNKFTDLARGEDPVATLAAACDGVVARSARYQRLYAPLGAADELRIAFTVNGSCWGVGVFVRADADGCYSADEVRDARALQPDIAVALRGAMAGPCDAAPSVGPLVVVVVDAGGRVVATSAGGRQLLEQLRTNVDAEVPGILHAAASSARLGRGPTPLSTRLRARDGRWLRLHAAPMEDGSGAVALTVEPAPVDDLGRLLLESYGLTPRETEILFRLCRGLTTKEIAAELVISGHTVRDHCKAIYAKAHVNSRGELVAQLFSNHVLDRFHEAVTHVGHVEATPA